MNSLVINGTEFGVDNVEVFLEDGILSLSFTGNEEVFDEITEDDDSEWSWAMDAPKIYFNEVSLDCKNCLKIDFDSDEECAVYMMEHNALAGMLEKTYSEINFSGEVDIMGDVMDITFHIDV